MDFGGLGAGMGAAQANANVDLMSWYVFYCCFIPSVMPVLAFLLFWFHRCGGINCKELLR